MGVVRYTLVTRESFFSNTICNLKANNSDKFLTKIVFINFEMIYIYIKKHNIFWVK